MNEEELDTTQSGRSLAASDLFAPFVAWLAANDEKPQKKSKQAIGEFIAGIGALEYSRDCLTWLANLAIVELESQDADNRLREISDNARESYIATIRRGA